VSDRILAAVTASPSNTSSCATSRPPICGPAARCLRTACSEVCGPRRCGWPHRPSIPGCP